MDSHGMNRIPSYMARVREGVLDPAAVPILLQITPVVAQVDGHNAFGLLGASMGMKAATDMAAVYALAWYPSNIRTISGCQRGSCNKPSTLA